MLLTSYICIYSCDYILLYQELHFQHSGTPRVSNFFAPVGASPLHDSADLDHVVRFGGQTIRHRVCDFIVPEPEGEGGGETKREMGFHTEKQLRKPKESMFLVFCLYYMFFV